MKHYTPIVIVAVVLSFILLSSSTSSLLKLDPSATNECSISFGKYHGHRYKSVGTIGEGKCLVQSRWMQVMQVSKFGSV